MDSAISRNIRTVGGDVDYSARRLEADAVRPAFSPSPISEIYHIRGSGTERAERAALLSERCRPRWMSGDGAPSRAETPRVATTNRARRSRGAYLRLRKPYPSLPSRADIAPSTPRG